MSEASPARPSRGESAGASPLQNLKNWLKNLRRGRNGDTLRETIEELIECPVTLLSTSPERDDTILMKDPFSD